MEKGGVKVVEEGVGSVEEEVDIGKGKEEEVGI